MQRKSPLLLHHTSCEFTAATVGALLILVWRDVPTPSVLSTLRSISGRHAAKHPEGIVSLSIAMPQAIGRLEPQLRKAASEVFSSLSDRLKGRAQVILGHGFWVRLTRLAIDTSHLLSGATSYPSGTFHSVDDAVGWLKGIPGLNHTLQAVSDEVIIDIKLLVDGEMQSTLQDAAV